MTGKSISILFFCLAIFLFCSCSSDSENADINKEWTLVDMTYAGTNSVGNESVTFDGVLVEGTASMQFEEDPNTVRSIGSFTIQLESREGNDIRLSRASQTFEQFGTWLRDGNIISTSADNSFNTDLQIARLTEGRLDLDFDYSTVTDFMGVSLMSDVKGTYFLASPEYINGWGNMMKGGWILTDVELDRYEGTITQVDGIIDNIIVGKFKTGNAPINFGDSGNFRGSGFFRLDVVSTKIDPFYEDIVTTSQFSNSFLSDGSYTVNGRTLIVTSSGGDTRTFTIIDANELSLTFFESVDGESMGPFNLLNNRSRIKYTLERKEYIEVESIAELKGEWMLADYEADLVIESSLFGMSLGMVESKIELISSNGNIVIAKDPNTVVGNGSLTVKNTQTNSGVESSSEQTNPMFSADNWIQTGDVVQFFGTDFNEGSSTFSIESLNQFELILIENVDFTESSQGADVKIVGTQRYVFTK